MQVLTYITACKQCFNKSDKGYKSRRKLVWISKTGVARITVTLTGCCHKNHAYIYIYIYIEREGGGGGILNRCSFCLSRVYRIRELNMCGVKSAVYPLRDIIDLWCPQCPQLSVYGKQKVKYFRSTKYIWGDHFVSLPLVFFIKKNTLKEIWTVHILILWTCFLSLYKHSFLPITEIFTYVTSARIGGNTAKAKIEMGPVFQSSWDCMKGRLLFTLFRPPPHAPLPVSLPT